MKPNELEPIPITGEFDLDIKDDKKEKDSILKSYDGLLAQVQEEYDVAYKFMKPKIDEWKMRLKLYNNQKRDKEAVGDTTMFTTFQTVLASLYDDKLTSVFSGREEGDDETAENLNQLAKNDYDEMGKDQVDFNWDWDTCFCGRGLLLMEEFKRDPDNNVFYPLPENIDFLTFLRDPRATSVNGDASGKGAMRFGGNDIKMGKEEMKNNSNFFKSIKWNELKYGTNTQNLVTDAKESRDEAQGRQNEKKATEADLGANAEYDVTQWFTHWKKPDGSIKKVKVWTGNDRSILLGIKEYKRDYWPIVDRPLYPTSHDWDGTSIPDLTEDKQRARAVAQNLGLKAMKADLYPMYIYNTNKLTNRNDLNFDFNKYIGVDIKTGENLSDSVMPLTKARPNLQLLDFVFQSLDISAQKATATPELQQGAISAKKRTLGELNLVASSTGTRFSLSSKIFGWSDKKFWQMWYDMYKDNFAEDIDEKVLRIVGAFGAKWRKLSKKDIIANIDPDISIESEAINRAKQMEDRQSLTSYFTLALTDPTVNRRYGLKELAKVNGLTKDKIERLFPLTIDERIAEDQNDMLNQNKTVPVLPEDDHNVHLEIHAKAKETDASKAHIETHKKALSIKKIKPQLFPQEMGQTNFEQPGQNPIQGTNPNQPKYNPVAPSESGVGTQNQMVAQ
jgi:hypothetical protein